MACETFTILTLEVFVFFILMLWATPRLALFPQHRWGFNILGQLNMRNLSCGSETDLDTTEATVQYRIRKWMIIFADCKQSGMTVQQYCDANQLSRDSYY